MISRQSQEIRWSGLRDLLLLLSNHVAEHTAVWVGGIIAGCCLLAFSVALTTRPWCDEAWFADIANNLLHRRVMGMTILDPTGFPYTPLVKEIDRYTYWVLPGYIFMQVVWYKLFGLSLLNMRLLSLAWAAVALGCWYYTVSRLVGSRITGLLAALVLAADQYFIISAATGRMDMMCSALAMLGPAVYLRLRERFHLAVFAACAILAAALMTHPNAVFGVILLLLIVLWWDRDQVRPQTVLIAAVPFLAAIGLWMIYVLRAPDIFVAQIQAQATIPHRFSFDWNLYEQFKGEWLRRFARRYHLGSHLLSARISGAPVILYFASVFALVLVPGLRKQRGASLIVTLFVVLFTSLSCLHDAWYYLVYILPVLSAAVAVCASYLWHRGFIGRFAAFTAVASIVLLNTSVIGFRVVHNEYKNRYAPAVAYLKAHAPPDALIIGSAELGFELGFNGRIVDNCRMRYASGRRPPDFIVMEAWYYMYWVPTLSVSEPQAFKYVSRLLREDYTKVYDQSTHPFRSMGFSDLPYMIYKRN